MDNPIRVSHGQEKHYLEITVGGSAKANRKFSDKLTLNNNNVLWTQNEIFLCP